jgi:hypothetical protein
MHARSLPACASLFASLFAIAHAAPADAPAVPEPSAAWLFPIGLGLLAFARLRNR